MSEAQEAVGGVERARPWRRLAGACVAVEAAGLLLGGLWALGVVLRGTADSVAVALTLAAFGIGLGLLLALASRAVRRGRERVRGPVLTWQLLQAATAGALIGGSSGATPLAARLGFWGAALLAVLLAAALVVDAAQQKR